LYWLKQKMTVMAPTWNYILKNSRNLSRNFALQHYACLSIIMLTGSWR